MMQPFLANMMQQQNAMGALGFNATLMKHQSVFQQPAGGTASAVGRKMDSRIYVGSLHYDLTEPEIRRVFESFGTVTDVTMSHEPATGKSKGFCFIEYDNAASANQALASMNGFELAGRPIKVGRPDGVSTPVPSMVPAPVATGEDARAQAQALIQAALGKQPATLATAVGAGAGLRIHVGNVPVEIDESKLRSIFESFGTITEVQLPEDPSRTHNHRGYGFISYDTHQSAQDAVDQMNDFELLGRRLKVNWAISTSNNGAAVPAMLSTQQPNVSSISAVDSALATASATAEKESAALIEKYRCIVLMNMVGLDEANDPELEAEILEEASKYGSVQRVKVFPHKRQVRIFLLYENLPDAEKAQSTLHQRYFGGRVISAHFYDDSSFLAGVFTSALSSAC